MMLPSHLLASLLLGALASRWVRPWQPRDWWLALGFGVLIDADHLVQLPAYVAANGAAALAPGPVLAYGAAWQGVMHTPWALLLVGGACLAFRSAIPLAFWGLHMVQDFVVARHFVHFGGPVEWAIVGVLAIAVALAFRAATPRDRGFARHLALTFGLTRWRGASPSASATEPPASAPR